jgi:hypothetical protein
MDAFKLLADMSLRQLQEETKTANIDQRLASVQVCAKERFCLRKDQRTVIEFCRQP